jgi:MraZ protein
MLPDDLLRHAGIAEQAVFAGNGSTFQIWEPRALDRHLSEARDRIRIQRTTLPTSRTEGSGK